MDRSPIISVIGTSTASPGLYELAREVGRLLARAGCTVVCGGRGGVMEAVCRGVSEEGGTSVGLLPGDIREANPYVTIPLSTGLGEVRNFAVASAGEAVISIGGAFGTLSEIGFALRSGKPVIALKSWHISEGGESPSPMIEATTAEEAVRLALEKTGRESHDRG
ncbi:hypothetical protein SDC9_50611 [bioreactor metagenome]|uniref:TIGR00725 family protein n=1 Tax=bioreactor metagenome TaxID=1076179 RepID=A0A644WPY0_9ZZZZ|nr:TIGR00725 family protein [Aminivibrio sp.]MEA4951407.1 TIGR00725 family protein [Aminivibrio sp.]